jgi:hypothetical protein
MEECWLNFYEKMLHCCLPFMDRSVTFFILTRMYVEILNTFMKELSQSISSTAFPSLLIFLHIKLLYVKIKIVLRFFADINCAQIYCGKIQCCHQGHVTKNHFCTTPTHYYTCLWIHILLSKVCRFPEDRLFPVKMQLNVYKRMEISLCVKMWFLGWGYLLPFSLSCNLCFIDLCH